MATTRFKRRGKIKIKTPATSATMGAKLGIFIKTPLFADTNWQIFLLQHSPISPILSSMKCPCHSGKKYSECCEPYHQGLPAPTPLALMRSRYAAYALQNAEY